ncbi:uncharacterized protein LOC143592670 [Bidens hawaiensis]|uniref:uncharacterized protein LOC143592670 n=1 Tax=Bidens hawaiensis TaxID=980011 RepID=UPI00404A3169
MAAIINDGVEYRPDDEAWYTCRVDLEDGNQLLRVKFQSFYSLSDEVFTIADFSTHRQIQQFLRKFRPVSEPIDDNECSRLTQGMPVCAVYRGTQKPLRYYDAIVDAVHYKEHSPEMCLCSYSLSWQHGPGKGSVTETTIEDICLITRGEKHPKVAEFTDLVKQKLKEASVESRASFSVNVICAAVFSLCLTGLDMARVTDPVQVL